jgi:hypothetical protein
MASTAFADLLLCDLHFEIFFCKLAEILVHIFLRVMIDIEGLLSLVQPFFSYVGGVHIGARALLDINLIWFGYIARLSVKL